MLVYAVRQATLLLICVMLRSLHSATCIMPPALVLAPLSTSTLPIHVVLCSLPLSAGTLLPTHIVPPALTLAPRDG